jgi:hypothetical protein
MPGASAPLPAGSERESVEVEIAAAEERGGHRYRRLRMGAPSAQPPSANSRVVDAQSHGGVKMTRSRRKQARDLISARARETQSGPPGMGGAMAKADESPPSLRLALTPSEAAQALGCSRDFFDKQHRLGAALGSARAPEVRRNRRGRRLVAPECLVHARSRVSAGSRSRDSARSRCKSDAARQLSATADHLERNQGRSGSQLSN